MVLLYFFKHTIILLGCSEDENDCTIKINTTVQKLMLCSLTEKINFCFVVFGNIVPVVSLPVKCSQLCMTDESAATWHRYSASIQGFAGKIFLGR